jgi:predicted amidohydrolase YtcJ
MKRFYDFALDGTEGRWEMSVDAAGRIAALTPWNGEDGGERLGGLVRPAFVDAHCHILPTGLDLRKLHLGACRSREEILEKVVDWHLANPGPGWIHAVHYDQTHFSDGQHLTRFDLDRVVPDRPVLLRHSNGHASVANSAALRAAGVSAATADPPGGSYRRDAGGEPDGVLLERAHEHVTAASPIPTIEEMTEAILDATRSMSALGIACATDMMTGRWDIERELIAYREAARRGSPVRLRLFLQWGTVLGPRAIDPARLRELIDAMDPDRCRVAGLKIFADGAIGSATAAIYGRYQSGDDLYHPEGDWSGQLIYAPDRLREMILRADAEGWRVATHAIGDYACDLVMEAYAQTEDPRRHRLEHAMLLSDRQIERLAEIGCHVTMQPEFLMRFGHAYLRQLGAQRAACLKRASSVARAGIPLSFSSDRPIVPGDPMDGIRTAAKRPAMFDQAENVSLGVGFNCYTRMGAIANGDDDQGILQEGAHADFLVEYANAPRQLILAGARVGAG